MKDRCPKCRGFIFHETVREGGAIVAYWRCINCGTRIYRTTPYAEPELGRHRVRCKYCGRLIFVKSRKQQYCHDCRLILRNKRNTEKRVRICVICGKNFMASKRAKYCPDCRVVVYSEARRKYIESAKNGYAERIERKYGRRKEVSHALSIS